MVDQPDLFGGDTPVIEKTRSHIQDWRASHRYRLAAGEENCSNCKYQLKYPKWRKCLLMGASNSQKTDVSRLKVCDAHKLVGKQHTDMV